MASTWTVADITRLMDRLHPPSTAEEWDRVGLVLGDPGREVGRVLLAVDPVAAVAEQAVERGADLLLTHHPLLLRGASFLPEDTPKGRVVATLVRAGIALFNAHTNADVAHEGVAWALAERAGLTSCLPLVPIGEDTSGRPIGHGRIGTLPEPMRLGDFADRVATVLPAGPTGLLLAGDEDALVSRVAVSGGAGDSFLEAARRAGADVFLTADLRHHPAQEHVEGGAPALLCASHWASEAVWLPVVAERLRRAAREADVDLDVEVSTMVTEPWTSHRPTTGGLR